MTALLFLSIKAAVVAFVYTEILVAGDQILNPWYKFLERKVGKYPWIFKPLVDCGKCVSGQISLWSYLVFYFHFYNVLDHAFVICLAIMLTVIIKIIYQKIHTWQLN